MDHDDTSEAAVSRITDIEVRLLLDAIFLRYKVDFRNYAEASVRRRLDLALSRSGLKRISLLQDRILHDSEEFLNLLQFLTIPVSEMFRDPPYYSSLRTKVTPFLQTYPSLKIWVAGCSTGEEAYSMAILLKEEGLLTNSIIYATDINPVSLRKAELGMYTIEQARLFSKNYQNSGGKGSLADHYTADDDAIIFNRELKAHIVFSDHSLATDEVFSEMHFVSCRNVLIYFKRELQERAIGLFKDSLVRSGFLGIGSKESLRFNAHDKSFELIDPDNKVYRKK